MNVGLVVEIRNSIRNPSQVAGWVNASDAPVSFYQLPTGSNCTAGMVDRMHSAGVTVGIKMPGRNAACQMTTERLVAKHAAFVTEDRSLITSQFMAAMNQNGIDVYARGAGGQTARGLLAMGVSRLLVNDPEVARRWSPAASR